MDSSMTPMISVLLPVYNGEKYLREAIDSILNQTYRDFEFLIINDGSTDKSVEIIQKYNDSRIKLIHNKENMGLIYTLNKGLDLANGQYIARMDADDISLPNRLKLQVDFMENHSNVGMLSGNVISIDSNSKVISQKWWVDNNLPIEWLLIWENPIAHPSVMLRCKTLLGNKLIYNENKRHAEDYDLWCNMALSTNIERLEDVVLMYRVLESSVYRKNYEVSCQNSLESNREYISKIIGKDSSSIHRYFTTFSKALDEKVELKDLVEVIEWPDTIRRQFLGKNSYSKEIHSMILKDCKIRVIRLLCEIEWVEFFRILFYSTVPIINKVNIVLLVVQSRLLRRLRQGKRIWKHFLCLFRAR